jgi:hypothetical protein
MRICHYFVVIVAVLIGGVVPVSAQTYYPFGSVAVGVSSSGVRVGPFGCYVTTNSPTYTTAQIHPCSVTTTGGLRVVIIDPATGEAFTPSEEAVFGTTTYTEGASTGPTTGAVRNDTLESLANTNNEITPLQVDVLGLLYARFLDPCSGVAKTYHVVNTSTATTVEIANAVASQYFYICAISLNATGAQTVSIGEDDTDGCGSITAGLHGGASAAAGWSLAANGSITLGNGGSAVMRTGTANRYLCIITGQAVQLSGTIAYVSAP